MFDRATFVAMMGAEPEQDPELATELIDIFLTHGPQAFNQLDRSLNDEPLTVVRRHAHALKGAAANLGLLELRRCCAEVEARVEASDRAAIIAARPVVAAAYADAIAALQQFRATLR